MMVTIFVSDFDSNEEGEIVDEDEGVEEKMARSLRYNKILLLVGVFEENPDSCSG